MWCSGYSKKGVDISTNNPLVLHLHLQSSNPYLFMWRTFPRVNLLNFEMTPTDEDCTVEMLSCKVKNYISLAGPHVGIASIQFCGRNNDCKGGIMEQWHQKLHNNTSPDDVVICQAPIDYINNDFDVSIYWKTLNNNGITKECLLSYDHAICSEPNFRRDQKDGLLRDLRNYMRTLKEPIPVTQLVRKTTAVLQEFT